VTGSKRSVSIGITGTQRGTSVAQAWSFTGVVKDLAKIYGAEPRWDVTLHEGDCVGADAELTHMLLLAMPWARVEGHPCTIEAKRAHIEADVMHPVKHALERDHDIVRASEMLIACPYEMREVLRSGTWATVRYALKADVPVVMIWPDGSVRPNYGRSTA
jgi:hypothetical protein